MEVTGTVVIGGGQAGLAVSHHLAARGHDHVVLERGQVGERWRSGSWDSLHLLTPNWMTRLPGWAYTGPRPQGYLAAAEVVDLLVGYEQSFDAPVQSQTTVESVRRTAMGFEILTDQDAWHASSVVIATGWCDRPASSPAAADLDPSIAQLDPVAYRNPTRLADGGVLVVGASSTGVQLADELNRAGKQVVLAVGRHNRLPRRYRGMDIFWWLERIGTLDRTVDSMPAGTTHEPSLQLVGRADREVDLATLAASGITLAGGLVGADGYRVRFADDLPATTAAAQNRLHRVLGRIDAHVEDTGLALEVTPRDDQPPVPVSPHPAELDLRTAGITTVIWATGYRRSYPWLQVPAVGDDGELRHRHGITPIPGLYVLGQAFQRTRRSTYLDGVGADAAAVTEHLLDRHLVCHT